MTAQMPTDYYAVLGVSPDASEDEIKRAYRRLARELHPDANPDDAEAHERFKEASIAYETLRDPERRRRYDMFGPEGARSGAGGDPFGAGFGGINDLFDAFFGGFSGSPGGRRGPARGPDLEAVIDLRFEEAVFGVRKEVSVRAPVLCVNCKGTGAKPGTAPKTCATCGGAGEVRQVRQSILGQMVTARPCPACAGAGQVIADPCGACRGEGRVTDEKTYEVDVPPGVDNGTQLRLPGRGGAGPRGGPLGDLFLHVRVKPHERFRREDLDIVADLHVAMTQAALGAHLKVPTLEGDEDLVIPAGTQSGRVFVLPGRGVPAPRGRGRGELRYRVQVDTPTELTKEQTELIVRLAEQRHEEVAPPEQGLLSRIRSAFK